MAFINSGKENQFLLYNNYAENGASDLFGPKAGHITTGPSGVNVFADRTIVLFLSQQINI